MFAGITRTTLIFTIAAMGMAMFAGNLSAQTALRDVAEINEGLIAVGSAVEISDKCSTISPRTLRGYNYLYQLRNRASELGFSEAQINAYVDSSVEKARLEGIARARLAAKGVVPGQEATYCAVGQAEIAAGSAIGQLLR